MIDDNLKPEIVPNNTNRYKVTKGFRFIDEKMKIHITIHEGFLFDGASIPRVAWATTGTPYEPRYIGPGLVHDFLYRFHMDDHREFTRKEADTVFRVLLQRNGVSNYQSWKMYWALRGGGFFAWRKKQTPA